MRLGGVSGQAQVDTRKVLEDASREKTGHGARYLGYGLIGPDSVLSRACLHGRDGAGFSFEIRLRCHGVDEQAFGLLVRALEVAGTMGGLGARSRRGYGSLVLSGLQGDDIEDWQPPASITELKASVAKQIEGARVGLPEYTAFSAGSRHVLLTSTGGRGGGATKDPLVLLDLVGREMVRYRSYGRGGRVFKDGGGQGVEVKQQFRDDHDLMLRVALGGSPRGSHPRRVAFGLPHNYRFSQKKKGANVGPGGGRDRRASPLFIHIHMCGTEPVAVLSFLPARFLPNNGRSTIDVGRTSVPQVAEASLYKPIQEFLDRFVGGTHDEPFSHVEEVVP